MFLLMAASEEERTSSSVWLSAQKLLALGSRRFIQCPHMVKKVFNDVCKY